MALENLSSKSQRIKLAVAVVGLVIAGFFGFRTYGGKSVASLSAERVYKCVEPGCGHLFEHNIQIGDIEPLTCPKCGKSSGWKTETCYWAKDAAGNWKAKLEPTFVVLKNRIDPESTARTYCPDCEHEVVGHNRRPPTELMEAAKKEAGK